MTIFYPNYFLLKIKCDYQIIFDDLDFLNSKLYIAIKNISKYKITGKSHGWPTHLFLKIDSWDLFHIIISYE